MLYNQKILESILEGMDEGIALVSASGTVYHTNSEFKRLLNLAILDDSELPISTFFPEIDFGPSQKGKWQHSFSQAVDVRITPLALEEHEEGYMVHIRRSQNEYFSSFLSFTGTTPCTVALDAVKEGVIVLNHDARVLFYNQVQLAFDGLTLEEVKGRYPWEIYSMRTNMSTLWQVLSTGLPVKGFVQYYCRKNGRYARARGDSYPVRINGRLIGAVAVYHELNETGNEMIKIVQMNRRDFTSPKSITGHGTDNKGALNEKSDDLFSFQDILGQNRAFHQTVLQAEKASVTVSPVMLFGETGTGKEMFAQSIHSASPRKEKPFLALNCAAIPENLIEGILFGTTKGVYTGAPERKGLFQEADGGTFFLDELNSMPLSMQGKLLRVLEEGRVRPLGSKQEKKIDVRIISSCNRGYDELLEESTLRRDLFYRLAVVTLVIPPLRERKEDIAAFVDRFIGMFNRKLGKKVQGPSATYMKEILSYNWPGNVRQLKHCIESSMNMISDNRDTFDQGDLPEYLQGFSQSTTIYEQGYFEQKGAFPEVDNPAPCEKAISLIIRENERSEIVEALIRCRGNVSRAAKELGMKRGSLYYRIKKYGIK